MITHKIRVGSLASPWACVWCHQVIPRDSGAMFVDFGELLPPSRYEVVCLPCWEHWEMTEAMGVTA